MTNIQNFFEVHDAKISELEYKFTEYWSGIDKYSIRKWISQFNEEHRGLALKLLQKVDYYNQARVMRSSRALHSQLMEIIDENLGNTYFASFTPPGKSGDEILPRYRLANRLRGSRFDEKFIYVSDLSKFANQENLSFVFLDDFVGSGSQALKIWQNIEGFLTKASDVFLMVMVGYTHGIEHIQRTTPLKVIANRFLSEGAKVFSEENRDFSQGEKEIIKSYCQLTGDSWPEGYGGCQSLIVFFHRVPNNTISILRADTQTWKGLFPRF
jgi:hypothetical protein